MKVFLEPSTSSRGIMRVRDALVRYKPDSVEIVDDIKDCDLAILHIYGRHTTNMHKIGWLKKQGKQYAMIQYCLKSTMRPKASQWVEMWTNAKLVWSYYNLPLICSEERADEYVAPRNFFYAPLGVDSVTFKDGNLYKHYVIAASAQHALSESVRECAFATKAVGKKMIHIGHELRRGEDIVCKSNLTDSELAEIYSQSEFVSGLRRDEGFELPVIEGLLCGARPIVFDRPEMRQWYSKFAVFIPEGTREEVIESLKNVFEKGAEPVTSEEKEFVKENFNWETIIKKFWEKTLI